MEDLELKNQFYIQWHITDRCNLRCKHCYQEDYTSKSELSLDKLISIAQKILKTISKWDKTADISLTGGEPFIRKDLFPFIDYLNNDEAVGTLDILTNGSIINEEIIKKIIQNNKIRYIQISLDGATKEVHDQIRGKGTYQKTLDGIRILKDNGIEVRLMFTLHQLNKGEVPALIEMAIKEKIDGLTIERFVPISSSNTNIKVLNSNELNEIYTYISSRADNEFAKGNKLKILKYRPLWVLIDPCRKADGSEPHKELGAICSIGLDGICILPDATVLSCRRLPIPIGNLLEDSLEKIWTTSPLLWEIADKRNLKGKCHDCKYISRCSGCRAMSYATNGDYLAEDPQCWL